MDLDVFHRAREMNVILPVLWPVKTDTPGSRAELAETLTNMTACKLFGDLLVCMLVSHLQWYTKEAGLGAVARATQALKRMLHLCYPHGVRNDLLFAEAKAFADIVKKKSFWTKDELRRIQKTLHVSDDTVSYTLHDAFNCVIYVDVLKALDDPLELPEEAQLTVYDTWEYDTDHIIACLLSMATVIGVIIKKHFDNIPKLPKLPMELQYKQGANKWKNYLVCVAWTFLIMAHLVMADSKNEFVRIMTMAKTLFVERYILDAVKKADPDMHKTFLLLANIIVRLHAAMFKMRDFMAVKGGLGALTALAPMGTEENSYGMYYKFPLTSVNHDLPITKHAVGIAHSCVLIIKSFPHLWTFLTVDKAWTKASNLHAVVFVDDIPMPSWCLNEKDFKDLRKLEAETSRKMVELDLQSFL
jgi:hypothetical protein